MAAGGSDRQLSGDALTVRRLKSGALPAAAASILNMLKRPRHSVGGALPPRGGDAAPMPGAPATASLASTTSAVRTSPPPRLASQLVGGLPPSRGQLKVTATHFDLRLPWPPGVGSENKAAGDGAAPPASTWAPKPNGLRERDGRTPTERQQRGGAYYNRVAVGGRCVRAGSRTASARQGQRSLPFARACHGIPAA